MLSFVFLYGEKLIVCDFVVSVITKKRSNPLLTHAGVWFTLTLTRTQAMFHEWSVRENFDKKIKGKEQRLYEHLVRNNNDQARPNVIWQDFNGLFAVPKRALEVKRWDPSVYKFMKEHNGVILDTGERIKIDTGLLQRYEDEEERSSKEEDMKSEHSSESADTLFRLRSGKHLQGTLIPYS